MVSSPELDMRRRRADVRWSVWGTCIVALIVSSASAESFSWGYISTNVTHRIAGGRTERLKFVSEVFGYCGSEISRDSIVNDKENELRARIRAVVGDDNFEITDNFVNGANSTREIAERRRATDLRDSGYSRHESWDCACEYPSRACR